MNQNEEQSKEALAAAKLKEVYQDIKNKDADGGQSTTTDDQPTSEEAKEQIKGSDADVDKGTINDDQPTLDEAQEQIKGSDADSAN